MDGEKININELKRYNKNPDKRFGKAEIRICKGCKMEFIEYKCRSRDLCFYCNMGVLQYWYDNRPNAEKVRIKQNWFKELINKIRGVK